MDHQYSAYKNASQMAIRKTKQVVMLYEGAISAVQQARTAIENNDIQTRYNALSKACEILNGLQLCLDFEKGGEVAQLLYDYYAGLDMRLLSVHQTNSAEMCQACVDQLKMMCEAWEEVDKDQDKANAQEVSTTPSKDSVEIAAELQAEAPSLPYAQETAAYAANSAQENVSDEDDEDSHSYDRRMLDPLQAAAQNLAVMA